MQKFKERLDHAQHNEAVCEYLMLNDKFTDWVITTAFYASLQYVTYKTFPYVYTNSKGEKRTFQSIDDYLEYRKHTLGNATANKHRLLADIVEEKCPEISSEYAHLLGMCKNARYINYQMPKESANHARSVMQKVKKYCTK